MPKILRKSCVKAVEPVQKSSGSAYIFYTPLASNTPAPMDNPASFPEILRSIHPAFSTAKNGKLPVLRPALPTSSTALIITTTIYK